MIKFMVCDIGAAISIRNLPIKSGRQHQIPGPSQKYPGKEKVKIQAEVIPKFSLRTSGRHHQPLGYLKLQYRLNYKVHSEVMLNVLLCTKGRQHQPSVTSPNDR